MKEDDYKEIIKMLRGIASDAINLKNNFGLSEDDIRNILYKETMIEQYITDEYIYGGNDD